MTRTIIGIILILVALIGAYTILQAAIEGDRAVKSLTETYGERTSSEWYHHQPARDLFHGELSETAEILYMGHLLFLAYAAIGYLGCGIGVQGSRPKSTACVIILSVGLFVALAWPWIAYGPSIEIVARVVD